MFSLGRKRSSIVVQARPNATDCSGAVLFVAPRTPTADRYNGAQDHVPAFDKGSVTAESLVESRQARRYDETTLCSIVVPMLNESGTVDEFGQRVGNLMNELRGPCEVILVDDGSTDQTYAMMLALRARDPRFKVVSLSRNFGHQLAITAGLDAAKGDIVLIMDGDLQHPPELLHEFILLWTQGYDVVYGVMTGREGRSWSKKFTAAAFYQVLHLLTPVKAPPGAGDFRLVDRKAVDAFLTLRETHRFVRGMWDWVGFRQVGVPYVPEQRHAGKSKYTLSKMTRFALDGIISFSNLPLRVFLGLGALLAFVSVAGGIGDVVARLFDPRAVPSWAAFALIGSTVLAVQLLTFGLLGEYVTRIYDEVKARPIYIARDRHGFGESEVITHHARRS